MGVLVTGAAGFVGSHVVDSLLAGGSRVVALDSNETAEVVESLQREMRFEAEVEHLPLQPCDPARTVANVRKAEALLGLEDWTDFSSGLRRFLDWFDDQAAFRARSPSGWRIGAG